MRPNKLSIIGIFMIIFAVFLFATHYLDRIILIITYPLLEGSSEGKSVLLFGLMGSFLLFYPLFKSNGIFGKKISSFSPLKVEGQKYLKFTIITIFFTYLVGLLIEIWIRIKFGVSLFTIFVSYNSNDFSTTALTHSHVFKSVLGSIIHLMGINISSGINTGSSLLQYTIPLSFIVLITFPLIYIAGIIALSEKRDLYKVILAFALTLSFIGMLDGGLLDFPAWIGLFGLLVIYFIKKPFSPRNLSKPVIIIGLIIILRLSISVFGSNIDYHEITIIDPSENIDLNGYDVLSIQKEGNKMIVKVPGNTFDKSLLLKLIPDLKGKCSGFFLSWNAYSWT
ncbi:MAG: hypothetical protein ACXVHR_01650 [Methanobacterium sp.]